MKSVSAIFILVLMVSIQTPLGQLLKLPLLVEHFIKHQRNDGDSLMAFLTDHYATDHDDADLPEDDQLPFKNVTFNSIGYAIITPFMQANLATATAGEQQISFPHVYSPQQHLARIFHPPRV